MEAKDNTIKNEVFGEMVFQHGWQGKTEVVLWGKSYKIILDAAAYTKTEAISAEQEEAYAKFKKSISEKQKLIESLLMDYFDNELDEQEMIQRLIPTSLVIEREGETALLLSDNKDPDNGLAVVLSPDEEVMTQDEFL